MGGKHKAQRTKNNVRPSSSGRSAELLGSNVSSFVGFSAIKDTGYVPVLPGFSGGEEFNSNINPDFQLVLKKMNKKDSTTKLKGLKQFGSLSQDADPTIMKTILPFWTRLYVVLSNDNDHRVREAVHVAHKSVVSNVGKNIAPYLKQIAGAWFTSQFDTYPPAASAASLSFQEAFSRNKMTEAIIFCQEEILNYIVDNLINQTPQMLSNPKTTSIEDMESKYQRVIVSSLYGYGFYLGQLNTQLILKAEEINKKLIENSKFWKYSKHSASMIRAAWFSAIVNLCSKAPLLLCNVKKQLVTTVFNSLNDTNSVVLPMVWEASLHIIVTIEDWYEQVSAEKLLFPKLWKILKEGGSGCASSIFPILLPLINKIPDDLIPEKQMFYSNFFSCLFEGIKQRTIYTSIVESEAAAECYIECFNYVIALRNGDSKFSSQLVSDQLLRVIEFTLSDAKLHVFRLAFFNKLISLLVKWSKHEQSPLNTFTFVIEQVLSEIASICCIIIDNSILDRKQLGSALNSQAELVSYFRTPHALRQKKTLKVTFAEERGPCVENTNAKNSDQFLNTPPFFQVQVNSFVKKLIGKYFHCIWVVETCKGYFVGQLAKVMSMFNSEEVFHHLLGLATNDQTWNSFYVEYLSIWLKDDQVPVEDVLLLIFTLLQYVESEADKQCVLLSLSQTDPKKVLEWCLQNNNIRFSSVQHWLLSDEVDKIIYTVLKEAVTAQSPEADSACNIVERFLKYTGNKKILIKYSTVMNILRYLSTTVKIYYKSSESEVQIKNVTTLLNEGLGIFKEDEGVLHDDLINVTLELFNFNLTMSDFSELDKILEDFFSEVRLVKSSCFLQNFNKKCTELVKNYISESDNITIRDLRNIVHRCIKYLRAVEKNQDCQEMNNFIKDFLNNSVFLDKNNKLADFILKFCCEIEIINGNLSLPSNNEILVDVIDCCFTDLFADSSMKQLFSSSLFTIMFLVEIFDFDISNSTNNCDTDEILANAIDVDVQNVNLINDNLNTYSSHLANSMLMMAASRIFQRNFRKSKQFFEFNDQFTAIEKFTKELVKNLDYEGSKIVEHELILRGCNEMAGGICIEAIYIMHHEFLGTEDLRSTLELILEENKLFFNKPDLFSMWIYEVFLVETRFLNSENLVENLLLLSCYLKKQSINDSLRTIVIDKLRFIFNLGKLVTFESNLSACSMQDMKLSSEVAELLSVIIANHSSIIDDQNYWDFIVIAVASWINNIKKLTSDPDYSISFLVLLFVNSVCHLFKAISKHILSLDDNSKLKKEWDDVFKSDVHRDFIQIWVNLAVNCSEDNVKPGLFLIFGEFASVIEDIIAVDVFITKSELSYWVKTFCRLLQSSIADIQFSAFKLLIKLTPHVVASDSECDEKSCTEVRTEENMSDVSFHHLEQPLKTTQTVVDTMLSGFKLGDTCIVKPFTDGYCYTRTYFLLWLIILEICDKANSQLRFMYTAWIKENNFLNYVMKSLFCVMPEEAVHGREGNIKYIQQLFSDPPNFTSGSWGSDTLAHLSCYTYLKLLGRLPAEVRQYWSELDHKEATIAERLTASFVSPLLCANELKAVRQGGKKIQNMTVHVHTVAREVVAVYTVEESSTELVIQLPLNHPLGPIKVESGKCMVSSHQTRQWIMQLSLFLTHQNGSLWDALSLWKTLIDKKFEGVEECYICFSILHNSTQHLPRLSCQTCKKKFHNTCLYQWFTTSNKSTCPICRNLF